MLRNVVWLRLSLDVTLCRPTFKLAAEPEYVKNVQWIECRSWKYEAYYATTLPAGLNNAMAGCLSGTLHMYPVHQVSGMPTNRTCNENDL